MTDEEKLTEASKVAAIMFLSARAFNVWVELFSTEMFKLGMSLSYDKKYALKSINDGIAKIKFGIGKFEDWATDALLNEKGELDPIGSTDIFLEDGAWLAHMSAMLFNAAAHSDTKRQEIERMLEEMKEQPQSFSDRIINKVKFKTKPLYEAQTNCNNETVQEDSRADGR